MKFIPFILLTLAFTYLVVWTWSKTEEGGKRLCERGRHVMRRDPRDPTRKALLDKYVLAYCARLCGYEAWVNDKNVVARKTRLRPKVECPDCIYGMQPEHDWRDCPSCDGEGVTTWKADIA